MCACVCVFKGVYVKEQRWDKWSRPQGGGSDQSVFVQRTDALLFWWDQEATDCEHSVSPHAPTNTHSYLHMFRSYVFFRLILGTWTQPRTCGRWSWGTWPSSRYRKHNEDCCHGASSTMFTSIKQTSLITRPLKYIIVLVESCRNTQSSSKVLKNLKLKSKYFETEYKRWV